MLKDFSPITPELESVSHVSSVLGDSPDVSAYDVRRPCPTGFVGFLHFCTIRAIAAVSLLAETRTVLHTATSSFRQVLQKRMNFCRQLHIVKSITRCADPRQRISQEHLAPSSIQIFDDGQQICCFQQPPGT